MRGVHLFMILVLLPAIVALGHDIYLFTRDNSIQEIPNIIQDEHIRPDSFFASLGYIWTNYDPESYKTTVQTLDTEDWKKLNSFLKYKAVAVSLAFAGAVYVLLFLLKILRVWPFRDSGSSSAAHTPKSSSDRIDQILGRNSGGKKMKYKRK